MVFAVDEEVIWGCLYWGDDGHIAPEMSLILLIWKQGARRQMEECDRTEVVSKLLEARNSGRGGRGGCVEGRAGMKGQDFFLENVPLHESWDPRSQNLEGASEVGR